MRADPIRLFLNVRPFRPFTIDVADGAIFEVRHPEMAQLAENGRTMRVESHRGDEHVLDVLLISRLHVMTEAEMRIPRRR